MKHDCATALAAPPDRPCLRPCCAAGYYGRSRSTILRLYEEEGLPGLLLSGGNGRRRILTFRAADLDSWLAGRRERQVKATLDGQRYEHRKVAR